MNTKPILALVGEDAPKSIKNRLAALGFSVVQLCAYDRLQMPVRSHPDMLVCIIGDRVFTAKEYFSYCPQVFDRLAEYGYTVIKCDTQLSAQYPNDIAFNVLQLKNAIVGRLDRAAEEITQFASAHEMECLFIKQGYARCSTLNLGSKGIISADEGIANIACQLGIPALKIKNSPKAISISGYDYGFIGGACGVFDNKVYFAGQRECHPQGEEILDFCTALGFECISLCDGTLTDVGGIIFLPPLP